VLPFDKIPFDVWGNLPPHSGEMATLYGDLNQPGPYLVMMRWNPGWFSAPHTYATDRICGAVSGTWWVNSGNDSLSSALAPRTFSWSTRQSRHGVRCTFESPFAAEDFVDRIYADVPLQVSHRLKLHHPRRIVGCHADR
jgi:hypothetical protein